MLFRSHDTEELEVSAEVKNIEEFFVISVYESWAKSGSSADHLPELSFAVNLFEEYQIEKLGDVDPGIQHVNGDRDLGKGEGFGEVVDKVLGVVCVVVDDSAVVWGIARVFFPKYLIDLFCVAMVFREDDGFADFAAEFYFEAVGHYGREDLFDGIGVEYPFV